MRGSAVPTIVWSRAARKSASATPIVASTRARPVISADTGILLGHCFEGFVQVAQGRVQPCALLGWNLREHQRNALLHELAITVELSPAAAGQLNEDHAAVARVFQASR